MRLIKYIITVIIFALLQTVLFPEFEFFGVKPDILFSLVIVAGIFEPPERACITGFFCGLITDALSGSPFGYATLMFSVIGLSVSILRINFFQTSILVQVFFTVTGEFLYLFVFYFFSAFIWGRLTFINMIFETIFPQVLYTTIISIFVYFLYIRFIGERRT